jgi:hypothetical protein
MVRAQELFHPKQFQRSDELLLLFRQLAEFLFQPREKRTLSIQPILRYRLSQLIHFPVLFGLVRKPILTLERAGTLLS